MPRSQSSAARVEALQNGRAMKFSVNLPADIGSDLERIAFENRVSESSVIEVAMRHLLRRVTPDRLGVFLKQNGACLRRRS